MLKKFKNTLDKSVAAVSVKSESYIETSRIKSTIDTLKKDYAIAVNKLGETVYQMSKKGQMAMESMLPLCAELETIEQKIAYQEGKLTQIQREKSEILGETSAKPTHIFCTQCGSANPNDALFCSACGTPLVKKQS